MKRCPECRRDYFDDSLLYCLDDGTALLEGPASTDEPATAILVDEAVSGKAATRTPGSKPPTADSPAKWALGNRFLISLAAVSVLVAAIAWAGYRYYGGGKTGQIESIAVMPFVNESGNAEIEYLSDGMTETLINTLTQLPNLKVKPRSSAFRYKGRESDAKAIGSELSVRAILTGRLVQRGDDIALFLSLIDTDTEDQIWGKQYNRKLANILTLQSEVAADVSASLKTKLTGTDEQNLAKNSTANPEAYRLYLKGRFFWNKRRIAENAKAISFFEQAIALDPNFALAYAGLADAVAQPSDVIPHSERERRAKEAVLKALSLANDIAEGHSALAHILMRYDADFAGAERELEISLKLDPKWPDTYQRYGELYTFLGKHEEALAKYRDGLEIEPFNLSLNASYGSALTFARRYDEAIVQLEKTKEMDPNFRNVRVSLSTAYWLKGNYDRCVEERIISVEMGGMTQFGQRLREAYAAGGWNGFLLAEKERYANTVERTIERSPYYGEATILTTLGEKDAAFDVLNKSLAAGEHPSLVFLKVEPRFDPLRDDPRFKDLLIRVGFPG